MTFNMYWLHHSINLLKIVPFLGGWLSDRLLGDPEGWPHPIVWFGKAISAPMFWFALLGLPGMMAYKMVNTLDSMIGYKNERYLEFGRIAAQIDDIANYIPARLTVYLMLLVSNNWGKRDFVRRFGPEHASPNSGYPEAALAAVLDCQFGGTHDYFGKPVEKPYIGTNARPFTTEDMRIAIQVNSNTELLMGVIVTLILLII